MKRHAIVILITFILSALIFSVAIIPAHWSIKIIIAAVLLLLVLIILKLDVMLESLNRNEYLNRAIFISLETKRLDPENRQPSLDIMKDDILEERQREGFYKALSGHKEIVDDAWAVVVIFVCGWLYLFYYLFEN